MTAQQLKNSILQMAVQGKLVPQDPNDEPASVLLERIKAEKEELIKAGKIKKDKKSSEIFRGATHNLPYAYCEQIGKEIRDISDEIPFDIPDSWEWVRLGEYAEKVTDQVASGSFASLRENVPSLKEPDYAIMVKTADFSNGFTRNLTYTNRHGYEFLENSNLFGGELILSNIGSIGKCFIVPKLNYKMTLAPNAVMIKLTDDSLRDYLYHFILSAQGLLELNAITSGTAMRKFNKTDLKSIFVPVPPLAEQHRIVSKIKELLPYIDKYGKAEEQLTVLNTTFPEALKKSILQEAVQGKLVPQNPDDEPASVLLERIRAEKQALVKAGKIKKDKHESVIVTRDKIPYEIIDGKERCIADEVPFEIPDTWVWVRLSDVGEVSRGRSQHRPRNDRILYENGEYPLIQTGDVARSNGYINSCSTYYNENGLAQSRMWSKGTICLTIAANIGDVGILGFDACFPDSVVGFNAFNPITNNKYFLYMLMAYKTLLDSKATKTAQKNINLERIASLAYPLPPLEEQNRIVAKIEEIIPFISTISK